MARKWSQSGQKVEGITQAAAVAPALAPTKAVEAPRGRFPARVDEKGRLKLPVEVQKYLQGMGTKVFVTTLDMKEARIYPIAVWQENEALLREASEDPEAQEAIAFIANDFGADAEMDAQGRVIIHTDLRRMLQIENAAVHLECQRGRISVYSEAVYQEKRAAAMQNLPEKLRVLQAKGLR